MILIVTCFKFPKHFISSFFQRASQIRSMPVTGDSSCDSSDAEDDHHHQLLPRGDQLTLVPPLAANTNTAAPQSPARFLTNKKLPGFLHACSAAASATNSPLTPRHGPLVGAADRRHSAALNYRAAAAQARPSQHAGLLLAATNRNLMLPPPVDDNFPGGNRLPARKQSGFAYSRRTGGEGR
jgi:hypothetical protein